MKRIVLVSFSAIGAFLACGGDRGGGNAPSGPSSPVATTLSISAGNNQTAFAGSAVAMSPSVVVRDQRGTPMPGVAVTFAVTAGGGSLAGEVQNTSSSGVATVGAWTLGASPGGAALDGRAGGTP